MPPLSRTCARSRLIASRWHEEGERKSESRARPRGFAIIS